MGVRTVKAMELENLRRTVLTPGLTGLTFLFMPLLLPPYYLIELCYALVLSNTLEPI